MPKSHSHAHDLGRTGSYSDSAPAGYEQIQNSSPPQGNKKSGSRSKKTKQWIKHKIKGGTDGETPRTYLQEESRSPPVDQSRNGRRSQPPQRGPRYDEQGNYTGDAYIYSTKTRQLERQATNHHGSDSAQAGTSWIEEGESREETESNAVVRRPLSTSAGVPHTTMQSIVERPSDSDRLRQLSHIETWVFGAVKKNSELAGPENESAEDVIIRIVDSYERLYSTTRNAQVQPNDSAGASRMNMVKARDEVRAGNTTLLDENKKLKEDLGRMQNSNTRLENSRNGLLEKTMRMDREYKELKQKFEQESEMLNGQISTLNFQKRELVTSQVEKLRQVQNSQGREIDNLKRGYEERLGQLQGEYDKSIIGWNQSHKALDDLQADFNNRVRSVKADADDKMKEFEGNCERKMQNERNNYEDKIQSLESKIEQLNASLQKVITHKEQELLSQKQELIEMHEDEKKGLRTVIEDFKVATSRREHFKGLTDSEVAGLFTRLVTKIEDFSRLEWDYSKEHEWPLSETRMRQLSNSRKLKQKIVQNTLWIVLYQCFFLSPFRVLGAEGRELDAQWTTIYASGTYRMILYATQANSDLRICFFWLAGSVC